MGFMDFLRKFGILRSGTTSWRGDLRDRPATMNLDEGFKERKTFFSQENVRLLLKEKGSN
jgi:hypothetical protein